MKKRLLFTLITVLFLSSFILFEKYNQNNLFITYEADLNEKEVKLYWKNENDINYKSLQALKDWLHNKDEELIFATNAGMYKKDNSPQGLFIENFETKAQIDTLKGNGNFYLKPNGIFYITNKNEAKIHTTENFEINKNIKYATQSGPMLLINDNIHPAFKKGSKNLNIRNGVGVLKNGKVVFVMSKNEINFYDFANYFKKLGCENALYLDGFVSRTYLPEKKWIQTDGNFGVIIGITNK
ncbi:phosphodiester glycosidase family protein [Flavobacterium sediminilitoris]|uniref:Phosphodiester glycosidase family protein n=1 Tax=Flavobacterium sediminilitoris TaxID=2024526 RepID=A0ABY4HRH5_9FLAO|nr:MULTISPECIES: phosphodiester glycosidase family protein [Flavobacterium]UOX34369.1 phosphodiester glycosidase family protein [Flavobacterium sediminilitoris]